MTCPHCEELAEENRFLKRQLGFERSRSIEFALVATEGLTNAQAVICAALLGAKGPLSRGTLYDLLPVVHRVDGSDEAIVAVHIHRIRTRLGKDAVLNHWGYGYSAGPSLKALVAA